MKKGKVLALVCAMALGFSATAGCAPLPSDSSFVKEWQAQAMDEVEDLFGNLNEEQTQWVAKPVSLSAIGYLDELILKKEKVSLKKGIYSFEVNMSIDNNVLPSEVNVGENDMITQLRVIEEESGNAIAVQEIYRRDFTKANQLLPLSVTFSMPYQANVSLEVKYFNRATISYDSFSVKGIEATQHLRQNYEKHFAETESDMAIKFDKSKLYYFDLYEYILPIRDSRVGYDTIYLVTALQGLVNRTDNLLFIRFNSPNDFMDNQDEFWLNYLTDEDRYLSDKQVVKVEKLGTLLRLFEDYYEGLVAWDEKVPATSNVAATIAGVENLLPVRYSEENSSVCSILTRLYNKDIVKNLDGMFVNGSTGKIADTKMDSTKSAKNDAYLWAKEKYLDTALVSKTIMANHLDAFSWDKSGKTMTYYNLQQQTLANKDYYISNKAFFWDLHVWDDSIPNDDPKQEEGTDFRTLDLIMTAQNQLANGELITIGGFVPWWIKYTEKASDDLPGDVATEWKWASELGNYYAIKDADAYGYTSLANGSIYCKVPQPEGGYTQKADRTQESIEARAAQYINADGTVKTANYTYVYMGDYDAGAWLTMAMSNNLSDPNRGQMPLAWPVNMGPSKRVPHIFNFMYENIGENDYMVGDHNGYGYLELATLNSSGRPENLKGDINSFFALTKENWDYYDLDFMGFLIQTRPNERYESNIEKLMSDIAPAGVICNGNEYRTGTGLLINDSEGNAVPWSGHFDFAPGSPVDVGNSFKQVFSTPTAPQFRMSRCILKSPTFVKEVFTRAQNENPDYKITVVDPYVYMYLLKTHLNGGIKNA